MTKRCIHLSKLKAISLVALLGLAACAVPPTPYQAAAENGGYSDQRIEEDRFSVTFTGNRATPRDQVEEFALFRAAEVTLENGFDYFKVVSKEIEPVTESYRSGGPRIGIGLGGGPVGIGLSTGFGGGRAEYSYAGYFDIVVFAGEEPDDRDVYNALDVIDNLKDRVVGPDPAEQG